MPTVTHTRALLVLYVGRKFAEPSRLLLVKLMVNCWASRDLRCDLHGEIGLVLAGEHLVGHLVENLRQLGGVILADGEDDRLADFPADRVAQGILQKGLAEQLVGGFGEEALLELALLVNLLLIVAPVILELDDKTIFGKKLRRDLAAGIDHSRIDQKAVFHAIQQGIAKGRLAVSRSRKSGRCRAASAARIRAGPSSSAFCRIS